ncbi:MAG: hypothetical protein OXI86_18455, partial [Candidatus Poribacteria bacterium]|nr:hypothetical protein [Candidatus Poribacteria bacterium]
VPGIQQSHNLGEIEETGARNPISDANFEFTGDWNPRRRRGRHKTVGSSSKQHPRARAQSKFL